MTTHTIDQDRLHKAGRLMTGPTAALLDVMYCDVGAFMTIQAQANADREVYALAIIYALLGRIEDLEARK